MPWAYKRPVGSAMDGQMGCVHRMTHLRVMPWVTHACYTYTAVWDVPWHDGHPMVFNILIRRLIGHSYDIPCDIALAVPWDVP